MMAITPIIGEEMICDEMRGMVLIHHTGIIKEKLWYIDNGKLRGGLRIASPYRQKILRSVHRLAYRNDVRWERNDDWGAVWDFVDDDGRAIVARRTYGQNSHQAIIFATSESFWTKMVLKYR